VNLIRFHTIPDTPFKGASEEKMVEFRDYLTANGLTTTIRASRGQDIFAACGLLSTKKQQEEKRSLK
jgi:23S rRNA (adenine2503-C2)-methyltransferase